MTKKTTEGIKELLTSEKAVLYAYVNPNGKVASVKYIELLEENDKKKIFALLKRFVEQGEITNKEQFKPLHGREKIYEFISNQHRIFCFYLPNKSLSSLVLTHGFKKQRNSTPKNEIEKALRIKVKIINLVELKKLNVLKG